MAYTTLLRTDHHTYIDQSVQRGLTALRDVLREARPAVQLGFMLRVAACANLLRHPSSRGAVGVLGWFLLTVAIYTFNGITDTAEDRANGSSRPIASGKLSADVAKSWCLILSGLGLVVCAVTGPVEATAGAGLLAVGWAYSAGPTLKSESCRSGRSRLHSRCFVVLRWRCRDAHSHPEGSCRADDDRTVGGVVLRGKGLFRCGRRSNRRETNLAGPAGQCGGCQVPGRSDSRRGGTHDGRCDVDRFEHRPGNSRRDRFGTPRRDCPTDRVEPEPSHSTQDLPRPDGNPVRCERHAPSDRAVMPMSDTAATAASRGSAWQDLRTSMQGAFFAALNAAGSPLVTDSDTARQIEAQFVSIADAVGVAAGIIPAGSGSADPSEDIGRSRAAVGLHPTQSLQAGSGLRGDASCARHRIGGARRVRRPN